MRRTWTRSGSCLSSDSSPYGFMSGCSFLSGLFVAAHRHPIASWSSSHRSCSIFASTSTSAGSSSSSSSSQLFSGASVHLIAASLRPTSAAACRFESL